MCLSASVSLTAAAVLIPAGGYTVWRAWRQNRRYTGLAVLPALLGVQQLAEGMIWLAGARDDAGTTEAFSLLYMFFAWIVWPVWIPIAVYFTEPPRRHAAYLLFAVAGGMLGGVQFLPYLTHSGWLQVTLLEHAVRYTDVQLLDDIITRPATYLIYVFILIAPLLLASDRRVKVFGVLVALVLAITVGFFQWAYISVFCFGGALASLYLIWALGAASSGLDRRQQGAV